MVTDFNSVHKQSESPPHVRRSAARDHSRLPRRSHALLIQAINGWNREPKKWTKLYLYKSVETLGYTSTCKNSRIDKR